MKNLKENLLEEYVRLGSPVNLEEFCSKYKDELSKATCQLSEMPVLDNLHNLSPEQAHELIDYYGKGFLFSSEIENNVYAYIDTRKKLDVIESKRKNTDS